MTSNPQRRIRSRARRSIHPSQPGAAFQLHSSAGAFSRLAAARSALKIGAADAARFPAHERSTAVFAPKLSAYERPPAVFTAKFQTHERATTIFAARLSAYERPPAVFTAKFQTHERATTIFAARLSAYERPTAILAARP
jgi:hypothetical protein